MKKDVSDQMPVWVKLLKKWYIELSKKSVGDSK
jgi:hypothetical protein